MKRKASFHGRYEVHTRRELYPDERPLMTWVLRAGIVLAMLLIAGIFRKALMAALS